MLKWLLVFIFFTGWAAGQSAPVASEGRFCPFETYLDVLSKKMFGILPGLPLNEFFFNLHQEGFLQWQDTPLFHLPDREVKARLGLNQSQTTFSYRQLMPLLKEVDESLGIKELQYKLFLFEGLKGRELPLDNEMRQACRVLKQQGAGGREIAQLLERSYPIRSRLTAAGWDFCMLPSRLENGKWYSLKALCCVNYDSQINDFVSVGNFTLYSDALFQKIQNAYSEKDSVSLIRLLEEAYRSLAGTVHTRTTDKVLFYPSEGQLKAELLYQRLPFAALLLICYGLSFFLSLQNQDKWRAAALTLLLLGFFCHTTMLGLRCYILGRPPVSNMFETLIYVPWVAILVSLALSKWWGPITLLLASALGTVFFAIIGATGLDGGLAPLQPVLDSQYWLLVHVLMVVGSYSFFLLAAILGHFFLLRRHPREELGQLILQMIYIGTALLIVGTILGGVWAAQSWGRFWDWDPKESWAFISAAFYVVCIHAFRYRKIGYFGLAAAAVIGALVISFTWYGVNYILGVGLHSYGFGAGGEGYYWLFLSTEAAFLVYVRVTQREFIHIGKWPRKIRPFRLFLETIERLVRSA